MRLMSHPSAGSYWIRSWRGGCSWLMIEQRDSEPTIPTLLSGAQWPATAYRRHDLAERVLQFGTGMLLRAVCAALVDAANRAGRSAGRIVVVQSTPNGNARPLNAQDG